MGQEREAKGAAAAASAEFYWQAMTFANLAARLAGRRLGNEATGVT